RARPRPRRARRRGPSPRTGSRCQPRRSSRLGTFHRSEGGPSPGLGGCCDLCVMTTTTIRVSEPRELLAYLPYRLGFRPRESAVVVSIRGSRGRLGLVARVDLADVAHPQDGASIAAGLAAHLWRDGAEQSVVVLYASSARVAGGWRSDVVDAARTICGTFEDRVGPTTVWIVDEGRFYCFDCDDVSCPRSGWPLEDLETTQVSAQMVFAGATVAGHRGDVAAVTPAGSAARHNVRRVAERWARRRLEAVRSDGGSEGPALAGWRAAALDAWGAAVGGRRAGAPPRARELGRIDAALDDVLVRDAVVVACVTSAAEARAALDGSISIASRRIGEAFGRMFDPEE